MERTMRRAMAGLGLSAMILAGTAVGAETASASVTPDSNIGVFKGETLNVSDVSTWGEATVCVVSHSLPRTTCFETEAQAGSFRSTVRPSAGPGTVAPLFCSNPLKLYSDGGLQGHVLQYCDTGYWQNIPAAWNNSMSSYRTGASSAHLAEETGGSGYWYPGNTGPNHSEPVLASGWNDRVSSIYLY